ncbi:thiamine pyrophosphate-binding protein [Microbacterium terrisoli]|uniref:thiamine pyrophosphate-binding protein n=1 Tax=Microbacterium terrisoli TaxID=3242192 RepID=UPI002805076A|nr:thiamine pyrophosphate-binding protein [Microbacterium protaetiae]
MVRQVTVAEAVGRTLAQLGVSRVFGVVGSGNFHMTNALLTGGMPFVAARHEMGATCMADAYTRTTGEVSVVSLHQGCGLTNAMTGITEAAKARTPIIIMTGDTPGFAKTSNFYIDQDGAVAALGAAAMRVHRPETAVADAYRAYLHAVKDRRTVVLSVPIDLQTAMVDWDEDAVPTVPTVQRAGAGGETIEALADLLASAERPVLVAGRGGWHAKEQIARIGEQVGALLTTSAAARGLFHDDPWHIDVMGGFATDGGAELIAAADVLVAFGAGLNRWTSRNGSLLKNKTIVQIDDTPDALGSHHRIDLGVLGDTAAVAEAVADLLAARAVARSGYRTDDVQRKLADTLLWREQPFEDRSDAERIDPRAFTNAVDAMIPAARVVVPDGGNFNGYPGAYLRVPDVHGYSVPLAFQSIGLGLASAIGAGLAHPDRLPIAGVGDGGFMMSHVELDTAVRLRLGLLVLVYNDSAYGAEVQHFKHVTDQLDTVSFPETDIAAIARGYGCEAITVRSVDDIAPLQDWLNGPRDRPFVIDAKTVAFPSWLLGHSMDEN